MHEERMLLDKIAIFAFEMDIHDISHKDIANMVNAKFGNELSTYNHTSDGKPASFNEVMITTVVDFENLRYMMATSKPLNSSDITDSKFASV